MMMVATNDHHHVRNAKNLRESTEIYIFTIVTSFIFVAVAVERMMVVFSHWWLLIFWCFKHFNFNTRNWTIIDVWFENDILFKSLAKKKQKTVLRKMHILCKIELPSLFSVPRLKSINGRSIIDELRYENHTFKAISGPPFRFLFSFVYGSE